VSKRPPKPIAGDPSDPQGFPVLIEEYCEWMAVRGYSPHTIDTRRWVLGLLVEWLSERGVTRPAEVVEPTLRTYQRALYYRRQENGKPLSFATQGQLLAAVRVFFGWLAKTSRILHDPAAGIELPRAEQRLPRAVLSAAEVEQVLALPDLTTSVGLRDRTMMELLYATGIRRAELANLALFDLDIERRTLAVRQGKGRKDRMVPIGERAATWCARYLAEARPELVVEPDEGFVFLTSQGHKLSLARLTRVMRDHLQRSGVEKPGACHIFRHTMATLMLEGGADIRYVQQMLGHADIASTQVYTQVSIRALEAVHAATHPAASNEPPGARSDRPPALGGVAERGGGDRGADAAAEEQRRTLKDAPAERREL
jgi:integrase/recombinase XerD